MEYGVIEKQVHIDATPDIVYAIVSTPEHIAQWWAESADFDSRPGGTGEIVFRDSSVQLRVLETVPGRLFRFAWNFPKGETPTPNNSMIVSFELSPEGSGTLLKVVEEGMRDQGWEAAKLEEYYRSHTRGWTKCLDEVDPGLCRDPGVALATRPDGTSWQLTGTQIGLASLDLLGHVLDARQSAIPGAADAVELSAGPSKLCRVYCVSDLAARWFGVDQADSFENRKVFSDSLSCNG